MEKLASSRGMVVWLAPRDPKISRPAKRKAPEKDASPSGARVLLVGRVRELALYRAAFLRDRGFHVISPASKAEALATLEETRFDAVILTYTLSSDTVEEIAELMRQKYPECALITIRRAGPADTKIAPDASVLADDGPEALLAVLRRVLQKRYH